MNGKPTKVLVVGAHSEEGLRRFRALPGCSLVITENFRDIPREDLQEAEIFVGLPNPEMVRQMPKLRFIQLYSAGANNYSWLPKEITLANAYGAYGESIAEHLLTTTLMAMKRMPEYLHMQDRQEWMLLDDIVRFSGSKVLSVGMGAIGQRVASIGQAFGMEVIYFSTSGTGHCQSYPSVSLEELLRRADVLSIHAPYNERTAGLIGYGELRQMKSTALLVNTGRGGIAVEADLARALDEGLIAGAGLDVYVKEPLPLESPLMHLQHPERLLLTPHIAWYSREARARLAHEMAKNIQNYFGI